MGSGQRIIDGLTEALAMADADEALTRFVAESNRIEGIHRNPSRAEIDAHHELLGLRALTVSDIEAFVAVVAPGKPLRRQPGMNVRVGSHIAPEGGPDVEARLQSLLENVSRVGAYSSHVDYELLHPFMDGNGRSGRALWLWAMLEEGRDPHAMHRGFLHTFYYQTLSAAR